jgi:hypothetical protein
VKADESLTFSIMVVKVRGAAHPLLVAARSESGASRRLRPGGGAFAFEQLQDAVRVLPDRADVAASGRTGIAFAGQTIMITLGLPVVCGTPMFCRCTWTA